MAIAVRCTDFSTIDLSFCLLIRRKHIDCLHLHLAYISLLISFSQVLNILIKRFIHLLIIALYSSILTIHILLSSISNRSYRARNLVFIIVTVNIDFNLITILGIGCLSEVTATIIITSLLLLIFFLNTPCHATFSDVFVLFTGYDFGGAKVACFYLLVLFIIKALLIKLRVIGFCISFRPFMKLVNKLEVIIWDSFWSFVLFWARLPAILLIFFFPFFISLIIRLFWRRTEVACLRNCTYR